MLHYPPSSSAVESSLGYPAGPPTLVCVCCGDTMKHSRTILKFGVRREQLIFVCPSCQAVDTKELKPVA
ncbi:MAG: hypothetical protein WAL80_24555 [Xanthobacteraceae bacterium]